MIYLVGGPSRSGKSTLTRRVRKYIDGQVINGDALLAALHTHLKPECAPDIFVDVVDPIKDQQTDQARVDRLRRRDKQAWEFFAGYLQDAAHISHDDILLEGMLWPDFVSSLGLEHRAVFLVDTSSAQAERLIAIRNDAASDNNWMQEHHYSDERIHEWVSFNILRGQLCKDLCKKYDYPCFDIADSGMQAAEERAFEYLLEKVI